MGGPGSGGARQRSGPAPDPNALRRNRDGLQWTKLPATGRLGPVPEWPLATAEPSEEELLKWREVWTKPQAIIWEADQVEDLVAFYVRTYLEAMQPHAGAMARTFAKQLADQLYLTPPALASGKYVIESSVEARAIDAAVAAEAARQAGRPARRSSARDRLNVVPPTEPEEKDEPDEEVPF